VKTVPQLIMGLKIRRSELNIDLILGSNFDLLYKLKNMEVDAILVSLDDSINDPDCEQIRCFPTTSSSPRRLIRSSPNAPKSTSPKCATKPSSP
jgi:hypothetical protein